MLARAVEEARAGAKRSRLRAGEGEAPADPVTRAKARRIARGRGL